MSPSQPSSLQLPTGPGCPSDARCEQKVQNRFLYVLFIQWSHGGRARCGFQPITPGHHWFSQPVPPTEKFHLRSHPAGTIKHSDETSPKEGVRDLAHGDSISVHFVKRVPTNIREVQS